VQHPGACDAMVRDSLPSSAAFANANARIARQPI
jgi:hypothetical protein